MTTDATFIRKNSLENLQNCRIVRAGKLSQLSGRGVYLVGFDLYVKIGVASDPE